MLIHCAHFIFFQTPIAEDKLACEFNGSRTAEISIAVLDTLFTLVLPFGILLYMNGHILSTVTAMSRQSKKSSESSGVKETSDGKNRAESDCKTKETSLTGGKKRDSGVKSKKESPNGKKKRSAPEVRTRKEPPSTSFRSNTSWQESVNVSPLSSNVGKRKSGSHYKGDFRIRLHSDESSPKNSSSENFALFKYEQTLPVPSANNPHHKLFRSVSARSTPVSTLSSSPLQSQSSRDASPSSGSTRTTRTFVTRTLSSRSPSLKSESTRKMLQRSSSERYRAAESRSPSLLHKVIMPKPQRVETDSSPTNGVQTFDTFRGSTKTTPTKATIRKRNIQNREHVKEKYHNTIEIADDFLNEPAAETERLTHPRSPKERRILKGRRKHLNPLTKLQQKCFKMIVSVAVMFMILNLPSHAIRLQSLFRSLIDKSYIPSPLEFHLQQFFLTVFYLNFVINVIIYGACDNVFRQSIIQLPWHIANSVKQLSSLVCTLHKPVVVRSRRHRKRKQNLNDSRLVEIQIPNSPSPQRERYVPLKPTVTYVHPSPPCLLKLSSNDKTSSK